MWKFHLKKFSTGLCISNFNQILIFTLVWIFNFHFHFHFNQISFVRFYISLMWMFVAVYFMHFPFSISLLNPQDNVFGNMFCMQPTHHEPSSWPGLERWKWLGRLDARTSNFCCFWQFYSINSKWNFLTSCHLYSLFILGMRVNHPTATWRTTRLGSTIRTITSQHISATDKQKPKKKFPSTIDRHIARVEWDEHETESEATVESSRDIGWLS